MAATHGITDIKAQSRIGALPGWAVALAYIFAAGLPLALAVALTDGPADPWAEAAAATGIVGGVMMCLQLLSSGRIRMLSDRVGIDITMAFHKWAAPVMLALVVAHPLLLAAPVDLSNPGRSLIRLERMLLSPRNWEGTAALVVLLGYVPLSIWRTRLPITYEAWRALHAALALALIALTLLHVWKVGYYAAEGPVRAFWLGLALVAVLPLLAVWTRKWRSLRSHGWEITGSRRLAERLWEITLEPHTGRPLPFRAGQFAWISDMSRRWPLWFDHPFSIASSPTEPRKLRFIIQEAGDFTDRIGRLPRGERVALDAPHGSFTPEAAPKAKSDALVLVAGGVGIAPILGMLEDLAARGETRPVRFIYAARSGAALIGPELLEPALGRLDARRLVIADDTGGRADLTQGPLTRTHLQQALEGLDPAHTAAFICGPDGLITAATDHLHALGLPVSQIHYERFDYAATAGSVKDRQMRRRFRLAGLALLALILGFALR